MEGWGWLESEGFLAPEPEQEGWYFITRKARDTEPLRIYAPIVKPRDFRERCCTRV
jgi:hypothetical protein